MGRVRGVVSVVLVVALVWVGGPLGGGRLWAQGSTAGVSYSQYLEMAPGELGGQVLYPDGKTPAVRVPVRVWSVQEKRFVYQTATDEKGGYKLPRLVPGRYLVLFGDRVSVELRVAETAGVLAKPLNVIIPRGRVFLTPEELELEVTGVGAEEEGRRRLLGTLLIVGAGAVTAVGLVAVAGGFEHAEKKKVIVSP